MNPHLITTLKHVRRLILGIPLDGEPESRANRLQTLRAFEPELEAFIEPLSRPSLPSTQIVINWAKSFFPFTNWLFKYRPEWIVGDLVAGLTVGMVVIPQGMAYAKLAELPVEFGLYGSFMGVSIYWLFATSKDITIGPVAVMSQLTGTIVSKAAVTLPEVPAHVVASSLAFVSGCILFALGFLRLGFVVDFIPAPAIAAFMTSSAISIIAGQIPTMLGISRRLDTRGPTYMVIIHTIQELPHASIEAVIGLTSLATLCGLKFLLPRLSGRGAMRPKVMEVLVCLRSILVLLLYTLLAYLLTLQHSSSPPIAILGHISPGLTVIGPPQLDSKIIGTFASSLPAVLIVLVIEHIAIAKSFARINHYTISPSQELIAIGISNIFGPFVGAYPVTGSFSRTALKSKAGVRTPLAGIITGSLVLLAIYALTGVFYYIPNAVISSVIIHAVSDLIVWPPTAYRTFWRVSITDGLLFLAGVCVAIFTNIEIGIYTTVLASLARLLFSLGHADVQILGTVKVLNRSGTVTGLPEIIWTSNTGADGTNATLITRDHPSKIVVARLTGPLFYASAGRIVTQLEALSQGATGLVLELGGTPVVDATSVEALKSLQEALELPIVFCGIHSISVLDGLGSSGFGGSGTGVGLVGRRHHFVESHSGLGEEDHQEIEKTETYHEEGSEWNVPLLAIDRPCFQIDIAHAVEYLCKLNESLTLKSQGA